MVARLEIGDFGADLLDHARRLMAENHRQRMGVQPLDEVQIGMAQATHRGAHQNLARLGLARADLLDHQGGVGFV